MQVSSTTPMNVATASVQSHNPLIVAVCALAKEQTYIEVMDVLVYSIHAMSGTEAETETTVEAVQQHFMFLQ